MADHVLIDLPCGCQDVYYTDGRIDREHDHVECDGLPLTPSADVPACRDEDPAQVGSLAACYPDPPDYPHPEDEPPPTEAERAATTEALAALREKLSRG